MGNRSLASRMAAGFAKKAWIRVMDRVGGKLVSGMTGTSSDAPDARFEPKRDLYSKMVSKENSSAGSETE